MKTDDQIKGDIISELKGEPAVNAAKIGEQVKACIATLTVQVGSYAKKWSAKQATQRVSDVRALAVEIDVSLPGLSERTDAEIASAVRHALDWSTYSSTSRIQVVDQQGWGHPVW